MTRTEADLGLGKIGERPQNTDQAAQNQRAVYFCSFSYPEGRQFKSDPRNQFSELRAGAQDSGLFFCARDENWAVVFLASPAISEGVRTRWSACSFGLQPLPTGLSNKRIWTGCKIPKTYLGRKADFLADS